jgi:hypothetical protein
MAQPPITVAAGRQPQTVRIAGGAAVYFLIVFGVGFVLGPIRALWLEPMIGPAAATLCEAPFLLAAMLSAAVLVPARIGVPLDTRSLLRLGFIALEILLVADISVGTAIRGMTWAEQAAYYATPAGLMYAALLAVFTLLPALINTGNARTR